MDAKKILKEVQSIGNVVTDFRRQIHMNPELAFEEYATSDYIAGILEREGISYRRIAKTGILARIEGQGDLTNAVVLRADIDALPVEESADTPYKSMNKGVMHACGHDMHTAALLGALIVINRNRDKLNGTLLGLFQPGEELWPGGASLVLGEDPFSAYNILAVVGEHVDPDLPTGTFGLRPGKYMASTDELHIIIKGEGGHGALPHRLKDPVVAAAAVITALQQIVSRNCNPLMPSVLSIGRVIADGATNVIPDMVEMEGTFRTFDEQWRTHAKKRIVEIAQATARASGVEAEVRISDGYPCVVNSEPLTRCVENIMKDMFGEDAVVGLDMRTTGEDFGYYAQMYPSLFYRFGVCGMKAGTRGKPAGRLHTSTFDPDEKALEYAVAGLVNIAFNLNG